MSAFAWHARRQYVSFTADSHALVTATRQARPVYLLSAAIRARRPRPLDDRLVPPGFVRVGRFKDPSTGTVALLRAWRPGPPS